MVKRKAIGVEHINAPPNGYELVQFRTQFEDREEVIETVTLERESGGLKVVGYFIR